MHAGLIAGPAVTGRRPGVHDDGFHPRSGLRPFGFILTTIRCAASCRARTRDPRCNPAPAVIEVDALDLHSRMGVLSGAVDPFASRTSVHIGVDASPDGVVRPHRNVIVNVEAGTDRMLPR